MKVKDIIADLQLWPEDMQVKVWCQEVGVYIPADTIRISEHCDCQGSEHIDHFAVLEVLREKEQ